MIFKNINLLSITSFEVQDINGKNILSIICADSVKQVLISDLSIESA